MLKVRTLFSGIGSPESALKRLGIEYELVDFCEWDKYAEKSYRAIHQTDAKNWGDINKVNEHELEYADLLIFGSPCQDFSVAGKGKGSVWTCKDCNHEYNPITVHWSDRNFCPQCRSKNLDKSRSSLLVEGLRIIRSTKPKYVVYENVKNIVGKKNKETFIRFANEMSDYGYINFYSVLNAKEVGWPEPVPQNRERLFMVSILREYAFDFKFPQKQQLKTRLKDILEQEVDEKYYLSDKGLAYVSSEYRQSHQITQINGEVALCLTAKGNENWTGNFVGLNANARGIPEFTDEAITLRARDYKGMQTWGMTVAMEINEPTICASRGRNPENPSDRTVGVHTEQRIEINHNGTSNTLTSAQKDKLVIEPHIGAYNQHDGFKEKENCPTIEASYYKELGNNQDRAAVTQNYRIRKLTERECGRLMAFSDDEIDRMKKVVSATQMYKAFGNSIVVNCMVAILKNLLLPETEEKKSDDFSDIPLMQVGMLDMKGNEQVRRVYDVGGYHQR